MLLQFESADAVQAILGGGRVRYTCFDASPKYVVCGASTGSLYFFERAQLVFIQLCSLIKEPVSIVRLSPNENLLVATTKSNHIYVLELNIGSLKEKEKLLMKVTDHKEEITSLLWSPDSQAVFSADESGLVYLHQVSRARLSFLSSGSELIAKCDSRVVQLDLCYAVIATPSTPSTPTNSNITSITSVPTSHPLILASTMTKTSIVNLVEKGGVVIGKTLRDGRFGACYHPNHDLNVFAARPGKRVWRADISGKVLATMNFKESFEASAAEDDAGEDEDEEEEEEEEDTLVRVSALFPAPGDAEALPTQDIVNFGKMIPWGQYLLSYDDKSLLLVDVDEVEVLEWRADRGGIHDLCVVDGVLYVMHGANRNLARATTELELKLVQTQAQTEAAPSTSDTPPATDSSPATDLPSEQTTQPPPPAEAPNEVTQAHTKDAHADPLPEDTPKESSPVEVTEPLPADKKESKADAPEPPLEIVHTHTPTPTPSTVPDPSPTPTPATTHTPVPTPTSASISVPPPTHIETAAHSSSLPSSNKQPEAHISSSVDNVAPLEPTIAPAPHPSPPSPSLPQVHEVTIDQRHPSDPSTLEQGLPLPTPPQPILPTPPQHIPSTTPPVIPAEPDPLVPSSPPTPSAVVVTPSADIAVAKPRAKAAKGKKKAARAVSIAPPSTITKSSSTSHIPAVKAPIVSISSPLASDASHSLPSSPAANTDTQVPAATQAPQPLSVSPPARADSMPSLPLASAARIAPNDEATTPPATAPAPATATQSPAPQRAHNQASATELKRSQTLGTATQPPRTTLSSSTPSATTLPAQPSVDTQPATATRETEEQTSTTSSTIPSLSTPTSAPAPATVSPPVDSPTTTQSAATTGGPTLSLSQTVPQPATPSSSPAPPRAVPPAPSQVPSTTTSDSDQDDIVTTTYIVPTASTARPKGKGDFSSLFSASSMQANLKELGAKAKRSIKQVQDQVKEQVATLPSPSISDDLRKIMAMPGVTLNNAGNLSTVVYHAHTQPTQAPIAPPPSSTVEEAAPELDDAGRQIDPLTRVTYEAYMGYRQDGDRDILITFLKLWMANFKPYYALAEGESSESSLPLPVPSLSASSRDLARWVMDLVTACFEMQVSKESASSLRASEWTDADAKQFIAAYYPYLHLPQVFFTCNNLYFEDSIDYMHQLEGTQISNGNIVLSTSTPPPVYCNYYVNKDSVRHKNNMARFLHDKDGTAALNLLRSLAPSTQTQATVTSGSFLSLMYRVLSQLLELVPSPTVNFCVQMYPYVQLRNVQRCIGPNGATPNLKTYIEYLGQLITGPIKDHLARGGSKYAALVLHWFESNLIDGAPPRSALFDTNSQPVRNAHLVSWEHRDTLVTIITACLPVSSSRLALDLGGLEITYQVQALCWKYGFFAGLSILLRSHQQVLDAIDLAVWTDDLDSLSLLMSDNNNVYHWKYLLFAMNRVRADNNIIASSDNLCISKDYVVNLMVLGLGPLASVQLFSLLSEGSSVGVTSELFVNGLSPVVYGKILRSGKRALIERRALIHEILSLLDTYLWSRRTPALCPQFRLLLELEQNMSQPDEVKGQSIQNLPYIDHIPPPPVTELGVSSVGLSPPSPFAVTFDLTTTSQHIPHFYEESAGHWGVETDLSTGTCPVCTLPLLDNPEAAVASGMSSGPNVIVFPACGHAQHQFCSEMYQACTLCFCR